MVNHPKIRLKISPSCINSSTLNEIIKTKYDIVYCGIHRIDDDVYIYLHNRERMSSNVLRKLLQDLVNITDVSKFSLFEGEAIEYVGEILKQGGSRKKRNPKKSPSEPSSPPKRTPLIDTSEVQPEPLAKKPRVDNCVHIQDNIYTHCTVEPICQNSFHAVWSSRNGLWSPTMWVGPHCNLKVTKRSTINPQVIGEIFKDQCDECRLCRTPIFMGTYSNSDIDHIIPLKHGGTSDKSNLQALCVTCHRRKTALECKKLVTTMGDEGVEWLDGVTYLCNSHVHFDPDVIVKSNPKDALKTFGFRAGLFVLKY